MRFRRFRNTSLLLLGAAALSLSAIQIPAGTALHLRLKTKVSTSASKPNDAVEAMLIAPVIVNGQFALAAGATVHGKVTEVKPSAKPDERAMLGILLESIDIGGKAVKIAAQIADVENARESVDQTGKVLGILASETISARLDQGINRVAQRYSGFAGVLEAAKSAVLKSTEGDIDYGPGVEFDAKLTAPLEVGSPQAPPKLEPIADEAELIELAAGQPFRTTAVNPPKPSDITNLMFIGTREALDKAFREAGWSPAAALNAQSQLETFRAIAELRGYKEAPVSTLLLDGRAPDLVYQKQNNTFAQRHHLRIWQRPRRFHDRPVWVCAATHDVGIDFSQENRTFIHKIDSEIDRERAKVVNDLLLTGLVQSLALVDRPDVPKESANATGDQLLTDGKIAVLVLK